MAQKILNLLRHIAAIGEGQPPERGLGVRLVVTLVKRLNELADLFTCRTKASAIRSDVQV